MLDVTKDKIREAAEQKRREYEKQEREKDEQLRQLQVEANSKRAELLGYRFGYIRGQRYFANLDIRDIRQEGVRIGLFGPAGSGKSSFIVTCERALRPYLCKGTAGIQDAGGEGTIILEECLKELGSDFCLVDTRGFFRHDADEFTALTNIVYGRIEPGQHITFDRRVDNVGSEAYFSKWLHAIIIVLSATDPRLQDGHTHRNNLNVVREFMRPRGIAPITVITHHDKIGKGEERDILTKASTATGSSRDHTFFVTNYHEDKKDRDYNTEIEAMKVMKSALNVAERFVRIHKQQEVYKEVDKARSSQRGTEAVEDFFRRLSAKRHIPFGRFQPIIDVLKREDITTSQSLCDNWRDVQYTVSMSDPMKDYIDEELSSTLQNLHL
ncbi:uncharacterized protein LOC118419356 [Branchiostoma floridae]|uniref:Uncharacterized protein LOC118419356 n=1 Tax=Branchiostoma floridae TaxID=7739 RepID=A0A9J7LEX5_BRAFL|nr:uncharacterized protein LOC118419356 [Branchiostoma floridae]